MIITSALIILISYWTIKFCIVLPVSFIMKATASASVKPRRQPQPVRIIYKEYEPKKKAVKPVKKALTEEQRDKLEMQICTAQSIIDHYEPQLNYYRNQIRNARTEAQQIRLSNKLFALETKIEKAHFTIDTNTRKLAA